MLDLKKKGKKKKNLNKWTKMLENIFIFFFRFALF